MKVNLGYVLSDYFSLQSQKKKLIKKRRELPNFPNLNSQITSIDSKIDSIQEEFRVGRSKRFCGVAFVTFATEEQKIACLRERKESNWEIIKGFLEDREEGRRKEEGRREEEGKRREEEEEGGRQEGGEGKEEEDRRKEEQERRRKEGGEGREGGVNKEEEDSKKSKTKKKAKGLYFYGQKLGLRQAPEPSDVYWENLHFGLKERVSRKIVGSFISTSLLVGFSIGIYFLTWYQAEVNSRAEKTVEGGKEGVEIKVIGAVISVSISIAIEILKTIIPMTSE